MFEDHRAYFLRRARKERDVAAHCKDTAIAVIHLRFADEYERRAEQQANGSTVSAAPMHISERGRRLVSSI